MPTRVVGMLSCRDRYGEGCDQTTEGCQFRGWVRDRAAVRQQRGNHRFHVVGEPVHAFGLQAADSGGLAAVALACPLADEYGAPTPGGARSRTPPSAAGFPQLSGGREFAEGGHGAWYAVRVEQCDAPAVVRPHTRGGSEEIIAVTQAREDLHPAAGVPLVAIFFGLALSPVVTGLYELRPSVVCGRHLCPPWRALRR